MRVSGGWSESVRRKPDSKAGRGEATSGQSIKMDRLAKTFLHWTNSVDYPPPTLAGGFSLPLSPSLELFTPLCRLSLRIKCSDMRRLIGLLREPRPAMYSGVDHQAVSASCELAREADTI